MLDQVHGYPSIEVCALPHAGDRPVKVLWQGVGGPGYAASAA